MLVATMTPDQMYEEIMADVPNMTTILGHKEKNQEDGSSITAISCTCSYFNHYPKKKQLVASLEY